MPLDTHVFCSNRLYTGFDHYQKREVFLDNGKVEVAVYRRDELPIGKKFKGPALIEEDASVTVVESDMPVVIDDYGNIVLGKLAAEF